jgi:ATP-dependent DNA ligase
MVPRRIFPKGFVEPCIPTLAAKPRPDWVHEIKHDGYRLIVRRDGRAVRLFSAFDLLELNGKDFRSLPLGDRKARLAKLLVRSSAGIVFNEHTDAMGELVFRQACAMGLEGIVSKRLTAPYRSGPSRDWLKIKNPDSPAMRRARAGLW